MTWTLEALRARREQIMTIAARHGARNIRVFGSVARGDANADSDVDILIELDLGRSLFDLGGLAADVQELLGCNVDIVSERSLRPRFRSRVLAEAIAL
jgi:predicted nucleotidyltransferase